MWLWFLVGVWDRCGENNKHTHTPATKKKQTKPNRTKNGKKGKPQPLLAWPWLFLLRYTVVVKC